MIITSLVLFILSNAVINDVNKSIIYSRLALQALLLSSFIIYNNMFINSLDKSVGIYGGMFGVNALTQSFNLFIIIVACTILILTSFNNTSVHFILLRLRDLGTTWYYYMNNAPRHITLDSVQEETNIKENIYNNKQVDSSDRKHRYNALNDLYNSSLLPTIVSSIKETIRENGELRIIEYALVTIFILSGAIFLMSSLDLISMFLAIELQSYGLYILCTLYRDSESSTNSGLTYFLLGCLSSCFILFGSGLLYVNSGTTNIENIFIVNSIDNVLCVERSGFESAFDIHLPDYASMSLVIIIVGFLFKVSAAPFHFWSPDVYDGVPTVVTTFIAIVPKISIFIFILQLVFNTHFINVDDGYSMINTSYLMEVNNSMLPLKGEYSNNVMDIRDLSNSLYSEKELNISWKNVILISSFMSLIVGSLLGLTQHRIKRLLAYSTISHVGFILLALSVGSIESIQGYIFYIMQYTISNINSFFILVGIGFVLKDSMLNKLKSSDNMSDHDSLSLKEADNSPVQFIEQLKGYFYVNSYVAISLSITLFSFVGIPPLVGFFAKQMVLSAALAEGYIFITLLAIITSVIGAVYYLNIIKNMFFFNNKDSNQVIPFYPILAPNSVEGQTIQETNISKKISSYLYNKEQIDSCNNIDYKYFNKVNSALNVTISVLTFVLLTFIFVPNEWLRMANILSIALFKL